MRIEVDQGNNCIKYCPNDGTQSGTIILMHGLGDSADGLADLADLISRTLPYLKIILPTASIRPVTLNGGMRMNAWYDIVGLDDRSAESVEGISDSVNRITDFITTENANGLPCNRIILAGFSQGGAMSLYTGLQLAADQKLAGLIVMSGYLPGAGSFRLTTGLESTPVHHFHGTADPVVRYEWATKTKTGLEALGVKDYTLKSYDGVGHTISNEILSDMLSAVKLLLPHDVAYVVKAKEPAEMSVKELMKAIKSSGLGPRAVGLSEKHELVQLLTEHRAACKK